MSAPTTTEPAEKDLNVELPVDDIEKIKVDVARMRVPVKEYAKIVFRKFLGLPIEQRRAAFVNSKPKTVGRKAGA